nr:hypothetical protein [Mycobacterium tuberculosis]
MAKRDADDRREQLVHRLDRRVVAGHALLDVVSGALDDDDSVIDHDSDGENDGKACTTARSSTMEPRQALTRYAPGFMRSNARAFMVWWVSDDIGSMGMMKSLVAMHHGPLIYDGAATGIDEVRTGLHAV